ncbi:CBS domain-containing protein [Maribrevibacterium harenarium]|uniref:CBS domain-containing protein n=1 Tax=Maribrevibacterium harenarium TaxID=2589817 RepID=A0A501WZ90_9GAMM|nr:CBS domain-containing protein [Maribrevibacterium harenarium]TPE54050.1 CBS domain-containing protein [Maribrevibacterium harenarium]
MSIDALTVRDVMSWDKFYVHPETSIHDCAHALAEHKLPGLPVADQHGRLVGFVSEQDLLPALLQAVYYGQRAGRVDSVMQKKTAAISPELQVMQVAKMMLEQKPKVYPVVEDDRLVGIITRSHITKALLRTHEHTSPA